MLPAYSSPRTHVPSVSQSTTQAAEAMKCGVQRALQVSPVHCFPVHGRRHYAEAQCLSSCCRAEWHLLGLTLGCCSEIMRDPPCVFQRHHTLMCHRQKPDLMGKECGYSLKGFTCGAGSPIHAQLPSLSILGWVFLSEPAWCPCSPMLRA